MDLLEIFDAVNGDTEGGVAYEHEEDRDVDDALARIGSLPDYCQGLPIGVRWWLANIATAVSSEEALRSYTLFERHNTKPYYTELAQRLLSMRAEAEVEQGERE